jgi:predicted  nucleic acid-binding Zn-ribbon protein
MNKGSKAEITRLKIENNKLRDEIFELNNEDPETIESLKSEVNEWQRKADNFEGEWSVAIAERDQADEKVMEQDEQLKTLAEELNSHKKFLEELTNFFNNNAIALKI